MRAMALGISYETFLRLNPRKMELIEKGMEIRRKVKDQDMWTMGMYAMRAVQVPVEHSLFGNRAKSEYFKKPFLQDEEFTRKDEPERELTEEEKKEAQERILMKLKIMMSNFETSKM